MGQSFSSEEVVSTGDLTTAASAAEAEDTQENQDQGPSPSTTHASQPLNILQRSLNAMDVGSDDSPQGSPHTPITPSSNGYDEQCARQLRRHSRRGFALINEAMELEAKGSLHDAKLKYKQGLQELDAGIACPLPDVGCDKERGLQEKLKINRPLAQERLREIEEKEAFLRPKFLDKGKPVPKTSTSAKPPQTASHSKPSAHHHHHHHHHQMKPASESDRQPAQSSATPPAQAATAAARVSTKPKSVSGLKNVDSKMANRILDEIVSDTGVTFDDIVGLDKAKQTLREIVVLPSMRPELFTGIRAPTRGLLMYGPPGTGKTLLAKATAAETGSRFFNISASTLTSKWVGEGEKLVRAMFAMARELQPSIIFIDEIDSLLTERSQNENEASRRMKTELLVQFDGVASGSDDRVLVMGATNLPWEIDSAARRRFTKRLYIPLPDVDARQDLIVKLLSGVSSKLSSRDLSSIARDTEGYSGSDIKALTAEAALGPVRELGERIADVSADSVRPVNIKDFRAALQNSRPSVSADSLDEYEKWGAEFGS